MALLVLFSISVLSGAPVVQVADQTLDLLLGRLKAKGSQGDLQVLHVDDPGAIGVEEVESLLDLSLLSIGQLLAVLPLDASLGCLLLATGSTSSSCSLILYGMC